MNYRPLLKIHRSIELREKTQSEILRTARNLHATQKLHWERRDRETDTARAMTTTKKNGTRDIREIMGNRKVSLLIDTLTLQPIFALLFARRCGALADDFFDGPLW